VTDWDRIVREHGPQAYATAWRILGHAGDAEDVVQDVFLEVHRLYAQRKVLSWAGLLRRMAACRALDRLRQRKKAVCLDGLATAGMSGDPEAAAIAQELEDRLREAITQLTEREATVFCMRYFDDHPYQTIAEALDITTGAVAAALHKARARLEAMLTSVCQGDQS
jgi:RNA polymerase sigma-70 factor (ECF subfamily)